MIKRIKAKTSKTNRVLGQSYTVVSIASAVVLYFDIVPPQNENMRMLLIVASILCGGDAVRRALKTKP